MTSKLVWTLIFGVGTTAGGGSAFFLPERLWSDAKTMVIYKKGGNEDKTGTLKVGKEEQQKNDSFLSKNSESLLRVGANGLENISANYEGTQNNFFWMVGKYKEESGQWQKTEMNKGKSEENAKGTLSFFLTDISCVELRENNGLKINSGEGIKITCKSKGAQEEELISNKKS